MSDHCCISTCIRVNVKRTTNELNPVSKKDDCLIHPLHFRYTYDSKNREIFEKNLLNNENLAKLKKSLEENKEISQNVIDKNITYLNDALITAAKKSFFLKKNVKGKKWKNKKANKGWFNKDCKAHRNKFRTASKLLSKNPFNQTCLDKFVKARSAYKKMCRKAEKSYRMYLTKKLMELQQTDPKSFWKIIDTMNNWGKEKIDPSNNIAPQTWKNYFQGLLNNKSIKKVDIPQGEQFNTFEPILDRRINKEEIKNGLDHLKSGKAPGPDGILTEYLKAFARVSENTLLKMIRDIFSNHVYPSKWACNFLKPIYKKKRCKAP